VGHNHAFLMKRNGIALSKESNNLKNKNCFRYNGFVHKRTIGIETDKSGKGIVLTTKRSHASNRPKSQHITTLLKSNDRANLNTIRKTIRKDKNRKELELLALKRASAIMKSQRAKSAVGK